MQLTKKQTQVYKTFLEENPRIYILSGAKRAGKTYVAVLMFLHHIARYKDKNLSFIIGGTNQASIRRNILDDMEMILGKKLVPNISNAVEIFGNKVYLFDGDNAASYKKVRGFTAAGAFINEATTLHNSFIVEVISRCSYEGARVIMDTNTENPLHKIKIDYIDHAGERLSNGQLNIAHYNFTLFDNTTLDPEYIEGIVKSTPSGMFTDRDIFGRWVSSQGIVYRDFDINKHIKDIGDVEEIERVFAGVDWGYEHLGTILVIGVTQNCNYYVLQEIVAQHQDIDYWSERAREIKDKYGNIMFYCDSARTEHIARFRQDGLKAVNANKSVLSGIEQVAKLFKTDKLYISPQAEQTLKELQLYTWNEATGEPIKQNDDALDALRYAIYSDYAGNNQVRTISKRRLKI